jgi:arsenite methyltransferase
MDIDKEPVMKPSDSQSLRETVRRRYAERALTVLENTESGGGSCCSGSSCDPISSQLYSVGETEILPEDALKASLGCGNPTALAALAPGDVVLDLGSGGGIDVLLSVRRVGPTGFVYGLDMTDEMLLLAEKNKAAHGATNVAFLKGTIEQIPLPDDTVDVIISNCVINLSVDKGQVLKEAFRVLKPGGRFAVSDVVVQGDMPEELRRDMESWVGCVAGALEEREYRHLLAAAGFESIDLEVTRVHALGELVEKQGMSCCGGDSLIDWAGEGARIVSAFVRAQKPSRV